MLIIIINLVILGFLAGCSYSPDRSQECVSWKVEERLGKPLLNNSAIQCLLSDPLTVDTAVQIALLNNPTIQATLQEVGIAQADLVEAGLFSNPAFDIFFRYPDKKHLKTNIEYSVTASFIDIFLIPLRTKVAEAELELTKLRVANTILDIAFEVEQTFYELQSLIQELSYTQDLVELLGIQSDLVLAQDQAGNVNALDFQLAETSYLEATLQMARLHSEIVRLKEKLNMLLGFCEPILWNIAENPPDTDYQGIPLECLTSLAFRERLDLEAARFEVLRISRLLGIKQWWVYTNGRLGICGERDPDGTNLVGPCFSGEIPIFNYGQGVRMRLNAELRQAQYKLEALEIQVLSEIRAAHKLLMINLEVIHDYQSRIFTMHSKILQSSQGLYNSMGMGIDKLLDNKQKQLQAYIHYNRTVLNYWLARVQLDRALGGKLYEILP